LSVAAAEEGEESEQMEQEGDHPAEMRTRDIQTKLVSATPPSVEHPQEEALLGGVDGVGGNDQHAGVRWVNRERDGTTPGA